MVDDNTLGRVTTQTDTSVLVSLTSIPSRIDTLPLTIKSLLNQSTSFDKVILWLHEDLEHKLPPSLTKYSGDRFEIRFCQTTEPHRKLVETCKIYPDRIIVTCDDDLIYPSDWLERLLTCWAKTPDDIVAHMCRKIRIENGTILPYRKWRGETRGASSALTLALGWGGVLFPPGSLDDRLTDYDTYMRLCPYADDLWFKVMATLKGTSIRKSTDPIPEPVPIPGSQTISLKKINIDEDRNRDQLIALQKEFDLRFDEVPRSDKRSENKPYPVNTD